MSSVSLELDEDLMDLLRLTNQPVEQAAKEMIVLELYRRRVLSSGKAAEILAMDRFDFIRRASDLGISFFDMSGEELVGELDRLEKS